MNTAFGGHSKRLELYIYIDSMKSAKIQENWLIASHFMKYRINICNVHAISNAVL